MKKIMNMAYIVFIVFISAITFIGYTMTCEILPYNGLKAFTVKNVIGCTNQEYIKLLEESVAECKQDIMYKTADFSSEKTSYVLYKTNNTDNFFKELDLKNNGKLLSKDDCYSTLSYIDNFNVYPIGISSAMCDITIMDLSYMEKYNLNVCTFYTDEASVYEVMNILQNKGLIVELNDDTDKLNSSTLQQPYFLLSILICVSIVLYTLSQKNKYAIKKLNGYSNFSIIMDELKQNVLFFIISFVIIEALNFTVVNIIFVNTLKSYFSYSILSVILAFILPTILFCIMTSCTVIMDNSYMYLKGKSKKKVMFIVSIIAKIIFLLLLVVYLSMSCQLLGNTYKSYFQSKNLTDNIKNRVATTVNVTYINLDDPEYYQQYTKKANQFYNLTVDKFNGVYIESALYQISPDGETSYAEYTGNKYINITVNNNYLNVNPIKKSDGEIISEKNLSDDKINILVSEKRGYTVESLYNKYVDIIDSYIENSTTDNINMIVYKTDEKINSFNADTGISTLGLLDNPDIFIYNQKYMSDAMLPGMSQRSYLLETKTTTPYLELLPYLEQCGMDKLVLETPYISNTFAEQISNYIQGFIYSVVYAVIYLIALVLISIFMANMYIENNKDKIAIQKLCGTSFFDIYSRYLYLNCFIILLLSVVLFCIQQFMAITVNIWCFIAVIIVDLIIFIIVECKLTRANVLSVLKGK